MQLSSPHKSSLPSQQGVDDGFLHRVGNLEPGGCSIFKISEGSEHVLAVLVNSQESNIGRGIFPHQVVVFDGVGVPLVNHLRPVAKNIPSQNPLSGISEGVHQVSDHSSRKALLFY